MAADTGFPKYDLDSALEVARQVHQRGGGTASGNELATYLGYKSTNNGAYASRVASARYFGLVEGHSPLIKVTPLALDIIRPDYPESAQRARLAAFTSVPIYRKFLTEYEGKPLPDLAGIRNTLGRYGVAASELGTASLRLLDSAEQAGLFRIAGNRTKMIRPTAGDADRVITVVDAGEGNEGPASVERLQPTGGRSWPKIIDGALDALPMDRQWDEAELTEWLDFFERALRVHYRLPRGRRDST